MLNIDTDGFASALMVRQADNAIYRGHYALATPPQPVNVTYMSCEAFDGERLACFAHIHVGSLSWKDRV